MSTFVFPVFLVVLGIALLYFGGELLVNHAIALARRFGVSSMVIGLTVVAFATSAPELAAAMTANLLGSPDIAVGNAVGSNIANVGLILGFSALFFTLPAAPRFVRREVAFMVLVSAVMYPIFATRLLIGRLEGLFLFALLIMFLRTLIRDPASAQSYEEADEEPLTPAWKSWLGVGIGIALLVGGADALVEGASTLAREAGVPERVIGLTLVALGTSLPELAAGFVAGKKGEADLVMGNIVGSNIFNLLCILGLTATVSPISVAPAILTLDIWVMLGSSVLLMIFLFWRKRLTRVEGGVLLAGYVAYTVFLFVGDRSF
ncbi:MAG: calcium/sodium antiporter [Thermoanaerobaculia bacterium]|nr:calcium/sodium antiporter [Thermoanaerobaculia bacterium]